MVVSDIVVVGSGVAAGYFCRQLAQLKNKWSVLVIGNEPYMPYERPALTKGYLMKRGFPVSNFYTCVGSGGEKLDESFYKDNKIDFMLNTKVQSVDAKSKTVTTTNGTEITATKALVLGLGSRPTKLEDFRVPVDHVKHGIHYLRDVSDTDELIAHAKSLPRNSNIVILGGGYIGMETAAGLVGYNHTLTMVFPESKVMDRFMTDELAKFYEERYTAAGIVIKKGDLATGFDASLSGNVTHVDLKSGAKLPADLVIVGVGARPNTEIVKGELELLNKAPGGVIVDGVMNASVPGVFIIGELAAQRVNDDVHRFEHVHYARQTAMKAAESICSLQGINRDAVTDLKYEPYFYSRVLNMGWVLYGETPRDGTTVHYVGNLSSEAEGHFAAFWVCNVSHQVMGAFLEGGSPEEVKALAECVREKRKWPLQKPILQTVARIN